MINSGFTRKKVESLTLGEKLKKLRSDCRMSLAEVSKGTKIQVKYLEYLEVGQYEKLPADVYVRGFLRSYARYLNLDEEALVKLYERERNIQTNLGLDAGNNNTHTERFLGTSSLVITSRSIIFIIIVLLTSGSFWYLFREFQAFAGEPRLTIFEPLEESIVETSQVVVKGKTDKGARVSINNQPVFVGGEGDFSDTLLLQPGLSTITVVSVNRFDKEKTKTFSVEARYTPTVAEDISGKEHQNRFRVKIRSGQSAIRLTVESDGQIVFNGTFQSGEDVIFDVKERLSIVSEKPEETLVSFNDGKEESLGGKEESQKTFFFDSSGKK
ncbi:MAG: helix-turn-helix domain-containing protein [Candidatus Moranbacteria bacterium]|nr:helix-turn-helix domain-containing protein [Candidatus Moranbacteria bacterium]